MKNKTNLKFIGAAMAAMFFAAPTFAKLFIDDVKARKLEVAALFQ